MKRRAYYLTVMLSIALCGHSQWVADPMSNSTIHSGSGDQALPRAVTGQQGASFVSWFSNENGNYNVRLQLFDVYGVKQWQEEGLLVSSHPSMTWLTDWDLAVDQENCAIVAFQDIRQGNNNIYAYRISASGEFLWGADGLELSNNADFEPSPRVAVLGSGNIVVAWQRAPDVGDSYIVMQKITPMGQLLWSDGLIVSSSGAHYTWPFPYPCEGDDVLLFWHEDTGVPWSPGRNLHVMRYDPSGSPAWANPVTVYSASMAPMIPGLDLESDGDQGVFAAWYAIPSSNKFSSYVQHIGFDGTVHFSPGGVEVSTNAGHNQMVPALAFLQQTQEVAVFWSEQDLNQSQRGLYGQKLSLTGQRLWGDQGINLYNLSYNEVNSIRASGSGIGAAVFCHYHDFGNVIDSKVVAMLINADGQYVWTEEKIIMSGVQSEKLHAVNTAFSDDQWICVWEDRRDGDGDIYGQNIRSEGSLGHLPGDVEVSPDTVFFDYVLVAPQQFRILNTSPVPVTINHIDGEGVYWYIDVVPPLPLDLPAGDSLILDIYPNIPTISGASEGYIFEVMNVITSDTHSVVVAIDEQLLVGMGRYGCHDPFIRLMTNPAHERALFRISPDPFSGTFLRIYSLTGKQVWSFKCPPAQDRIRSADWSGTDHSGSVLPPGTYLFNAVQGGRQAGGRLILLR
ncbi:MAG: hypothetical protein JW861_08910 [Bacteroidales bacterium]|nr:hypothetical protein [Bacteroidales bacterium]